MTLLPPATIALLLAGGASTRMGRDKALLDLRGTPVWQHLRDLLLAAGCSDVLISAASTSAIPGAFADDVPGLGPLGGLASALLRLDAALTGAVSACMAEPEPRRRAMHVLLARLQAIALPLTPVLTDALTNTNSPAEWAQALARPAG